MLPIFFLLFDASIAYFKCMGRMLRSLGGLLEASWRPLGASLRPFGGLLEASWRLFEAFWRPLGASWRPLEGSCVVLESIGGSWRRLGGLGDDLDAFWRPLGVPWRPLEGLLEPLKGVQEPRLKQLNVIRITFCRFSKNIAETNEILLFLLLLRPRFAYIFF